jgi:hypothetical protein
VNNDQVSIWPPYRCSRLMSYKAEPFLPKYTVIKITKIN